MSRVPRHETVELYLGDGPVEIHIPVPEEDGSPKDLTSATDVFYWLYTNINAPALSLSLGDGITIPTPATDGVIVVTLSKAQIAALSATIYHDRVRVVDADAVAQTVLEGAVRVHPSPAEPA